MNDEEIIALYFARDEEALTQTDKKYGAYCYTLANRILNSPPDAEETVSDTYLKAWENIPPTRPKVLRLFLAKITRNLAFSRWRTETAQKRGGGEMPLVLDERGITMTSPQLAQLLQKIDNNAMGRACFIIGGAYGRDEAVRQRAWKLVSLSSMTFPHELARVLLLEQLYRAECIIRKVPYHH